MIALTLIVSSHRSAEDRAFYLTMWMCGCGEIDHTERLDWTVMDGCGFCRWPCTSCRSEIDKWKTPLNLRSCVLAIAIFFQFPDIRCLPDSFLANLSTIKLSSCHGTHAVLNYRKPDRLKHESMWMSWYTWLCNIVQKKKRSSFRIFSVRPRGRPGNHPLVARETR